MPRMSAELEMPGGRIIVSPDTNTEVISATVAAGLVSCPGYFTPSEAFAAIRAGATALKLFPAEGATPALLKAQLAVIPKDIPDLVVGGSQTRQYAAVARSWCDRLRPRRRPVQAGPVSRRYPGKSPAYVAGLEP